MPSTIKRSVGDCSHVILLTEGQKPTAWLQAQTE